MRDLTVDLITEKNKLTSLGSWTWLAECDIDGTDAIRICAHDTQLTFDGNDYHPYPMGITDIDQDTEGNINSVNLTVSNIGLLAVSYVNAGNIDGRQVYLRLVHEDHLDDSDNVIETSWQVQGISYNEEAITFKLGMVNLLNIDFPREKFFRTRCRYVSRYGGVHCGYNTALTNLVGAQYPNFSSSSCDGTLDGDNGCTAHGANEVANNLPSLHPKRFGGFPGIPKGPIFLGS